MLLEEFTWFLNIVVYSRPRSPLLLFTSTFNRYCNFSAYLKRKHISDISRFYFLEFSRFPSSCFHMQIKKKKEKKAHTDGNQARGREGAVYCCTYMCKTSICRSSHRNLYKCLEPAAIVFVFPAVPVFLRLNPASAMILPAGVIAYTTHNLTIFRGCTG